MGSFLLAVSHVLWPRGLGDLDVLFIFLVLLVHLPMSIGKFQPNILLTSLENHFTLSVENQEIRVQNPFQFSKHLVCILFHTLVLKMPKKEQIP